MDTNSADEDVVITVTQQKVLDDISSKSANKRKIFLPDEIDSKLFETIKEWKAEIGDATIKEWKAESGEDEITVALQSIFEKIFPQNNQSSTKVDAITMTLFPDRHPDFIPKYLADVNNKENKEKRPGPIKVDAIAKAFLAYSHPDFIFKYPANDNNEVRKEMRKNFVQLLLRAGLVVEREICEEHKYLKIFAPFSLLCENAQNMQLKFPLKPTKNLKNMKDSNTKDPKKRFLFSFTFDVINSNKNSAPFKTKNLRRFKGGDEGSKTLLNFFSPARRNLLVNRIINVASYPDLEKYNDEERNEFELSKLISEKVFTGCYPLHYDNLRKGLANNRQSQPWDIIRRQIREYFGEKLALYFVFMTALFLESWKRANSTLQYNWDVMEYEEGELPRPGFFGRTRRSSMKEEMEIYFPTSEKLKRFTVSGIIIFVALCIFLITIGVLLVFPKIWIHVGIYTSVTTALVSLTVMIVLRVYIRSLLNRPEVTTGCEYDNCFTELTVQLAIVMVGKQAFGQITEVFIPLFVSKFNEWYRQYMRGSKKPTDEDQRPVKVEHSQWVKDGDLVDPPQIEDSEYVKIVGYMAQDIGMWEKALNFLSIFGVLTNAIIIAFYSSWLRAQFLDYVDGDESSLLIARLMFIIVFEHIVYAIKLIAYLIPNQSSSLKKAIVKEKYMVNYTKSEMKRVCHHKKLDSEESTNTLT
ncbi:13669_t:CDS:10 [Cetraspora pellucida]|uniref:13669_t:CDS:1 n=1 Tax=Cetraspora pellucida TaxID=1433469 RepID=A0A9N8VFV2_9GLOM|nr:13669_t:CDS:10 [Cetraspora pellucida]